MSTQSDYNRIHEMFTRFREAREKPVGELRHVNDYTLLVAVVLSAQATDAGVNRATESLFDSIRTPGEMLELGEERLTGFIRSIGLYRNKARNIIKLSRILVEEYEGRIPTSRSALEALPGVGRKTANVVLNSLFGHPAQPVDTHVFRVANRTGMAPGKTVIQVERALEDQVPVEFQQYSHHWLILHGRYTCKARKPDCANCLVEDLCPKIGVDV